MQRELRPNFEILLSNFIQEVTTNSALGFKQKHAAERKGAKVSTMQQREENGTINHAPDILQN